MLHNLHESIRICTPRHSDSCARAIDARGISKKEAQALLLYAFANDAMQNIDIEPLKLKISKLLAEKLEVEIAFEDLD